MKLKPEASRLTSRYHRQAWIYRLVRFPAGGHKEWIASTVEHEGNVVGCGR